MSNGLPPAHREWLNEFDQKEAIWSGIDLDDARSRLKLVRDRYPMPDMSLARLFMEQIGAVSGLLGRYETVPELEQAIRRLITNQGIVASALSRRGRGKPEL